MTPARYRECFDATGRSHTGLADTLGVSERQVRRWYAGGLPPHGVALWLEAFAAWLEANPPPMRRSA